MKRLITLLVLLATVFQLSAQTPVADRRPLWVGLDMGGTWQTSDMKPLGGIGWSFTLSRYSRLSKTGPLYFGWRFRFMDGRNFGYTYHPLTSQQLLATPSLSTTGSPTNYTLAPNNGHAFANYKMRFDEFSFEGIVGSNGLRRNGVLLYAFGGVGLNYWQTKTDQLDALGGMYDYSTITPTADAGMVRSELDLVRDNKYETGVTAGQWSFMPSAGIGMGYQWGNGFAIGVEHRTTWALNDMIDGMDHDAMGAKTPNNDLYHYDGLFIRWTFGGNRDNTVTRNNPPPPANPNQYTTTTPPPPTNPNTQVVTNPPPNNNPPPQNNPTVYPPNVRFTTPATDPYTTNVATQQLVVRVDNVNYSSQIQLTINSQQVNNFSFNPNTNQMVFTHTLQPGTNVYQVVATNQAGSASDVQTIIFNNGNTTTTVTPPPAMPPSVNITNPPSDPYTSTVQTMPVNATVLNVTSASNIQVRRNGQPVNNFTFDPNTHLVSFTANLQTGSNLYEVIGTNTVGSASDAVTINYNPAPAILPPVVTITSPSGCPFSTKTGTMTITANITNVTQMNQVNVVFNNQPVTNFSFMNHGANASISFNVTLQPNNNPFTITGTNAGGTDSKSCTIIYKVTQPPAVPPSVTITVPNANPHTTTQQTMVLKATVLNVNSAAEITVAFNSVQVNNFTYDMNTHELTYNATFNPGSNIFKVMASNANGSDTKTTTIIYRIAPTQQPPTVTITTPSANPLVTNNWTENVVAVVMNVSASNEITVRDMNGATVAFNFNAGTHLVSFNAQLVRGLNQYTVTATNTAGTASDNTSIKLVEPPPSDQGRPGGAGGHTAPTTTTTQTSTQTNPPPPENPGRPGGAGNVSGQAASHSPIVITLVNPASETSSTASSTMSVVVNVTGVSAASDITVKVNGTPLAAGSVNYNSTSGVTKFTVTLNSGANTILVSAQNSTSSASKSLSITSTATGRQANPGNGGSGGSGGSGRAGSSEKTTTPKTAETKPAKTEDKPKEEEKPAKTEDKPKTTETTTPGRSTTTPSTSTPRSTEQPSSGGTRPR